MEIDMRFISAVAAAAPQPHWTFLDVVVAIWVCVLVGAVLTGLVMVKHAEYARMFSMPPGPVLLADDEDVLAITSAQKLVGFSVSQQDLRGRLVLTTKRVLFVGGDTQRMYMAVEVNKLEVENNGNRISFSYRIEEKKRWERYSLRTKVSDPPGIPQPLVSAAEFRELLSRVVSRRLSAGENAVG